MGSSDVVNHLYDYRPNWTSLIPVTITCCCHDVTSMKVTSMKYEKFNIKSFVCPFGTDWFCCHRCMLLGQIKKHLCYFLYWT